MRLPSTYLSLFDLLHLSSCPQSPSTLLQVVEFPTFLLLSNIPLYTHTYAHTHTHTHADTAFSLFIHAIFSFSNLRTVFCSCCSNLHLHQQGIKVSFSQHPCQDLVSRVFLRIVIFTAVRWLMSHCGFALHFPGD